MSNESPAPDLLAEARDLRARLAEAEETLRAIRAGEADALVIAGDQGDEVHLLGAGDRIYRQFIETIREGMATLSAAGEIQSCSSMLVDTLQLPLEQLLGTAMRDHLAPGDHEIVASILARDCPNANRLKIRLKTGDGSLVPVYVAATRLLSAGADPVCCLVFTDLEEVVSAEQELRESEERYRALFENSPDAVLLTSPDGRILSANPAACRMFGRTEEELISLGRAGVVDAGDPRLAKLLEERARTGRTSGELTFLKHDGSSFQGEISSMLFQDRLGAARSSMIIRDITERNRAESALRASRLLYQETLSSLNEAVFVVDVKTRSILDCNSATETIFGYSREELSGRDTRFLHVNDEMFAAFVEKMNAQIAGKGCAEFEFRMKRKNGEVFPTEHFLRPLQDGDGGRLGVVSVIRDITERKRTEDALRESKQLIEGIINAIPVRVFWKDRSLVYLGCNAAFARDAGFADPKDLVGKDDFQMGWKDQAELYRADDRQVMESGVSKLLIEEPQTTPDGKTVTLLTGKVPLRDSRGEICGVIGTYIDITDRKRTEADRERLAVAIEQAAEIVMVTDLEGTIQYVNPVFETVTGYTRAEAVGQNSRLLKSGEQDEVFYRSLWETISAGRVWFGRLVNRRKDGSLYTEDMTISPVHDDSGRIVSYVAVKRDITEQLRLAEEKAILEDQLRQAQKVEAIGRLAGGVAHDFNNMMAIILGYGEMILGQLRPEDPARNWAEQIMEAGRRSASLTRQLLAFSRKQTLLPEVLDLNALLRNLEKMFGRLIGENIDLEFRLAVGLGRTKADPGQIEQVVTNLVLNARDAMLLGGRLTVETANVELDHLYALGHQSVLPGSYVMLAVTDTGCGMDKATMARLFEPFFTTKQKGKGTGLGLATAYGIVKQSGGYIWAYSEPEHGTTFKIYLPQTDAALAANAVEAEDEAPRSSGERILLVEDEAPLRELCETVLVRLGYRVNAAGNGLKALLLVQELGLEPDLVITDVVMPGMSGTEMTERLRRNRPNLRVLYMSGYPDDTIARHGVLELGTPFLQKPFTERALALKVREALRVKPVAARLGRSVLMIDDDKQYRELVQHFCNKRGHVFVGVDTSASALEALAKQPFDVLLVDMNIPGTSGECVLREIRAAGRAAPAIVLTGDVASADMDVLRPFGVVRALEKSSNAEPLLQAIEAAGSTGG